MEEWSFSGDMTHGVTFCSRLLAVFGAMSIAYRRSQGKLTHSLRPMVTGWLGGERKLGVLLTSKTLVLWGRLVFGTEVNFPITISDFSDAFVSGFQLAFPGSMNMTDYYHCKTGLTDLTRTAVSKLVNRMENLPIVTDHIERLHRCKSIALFDVVIQLVLAYWRETLGEVEYAELAEREYFCESKRRWCMSSSGKRRVPPCTQTSEGHHSGMKGGKNRKGMINLNVSRSQAANVEIQKLLNVHAREKNGVSVRYPRGFQEIPKPVLHLLMLARSEVDIRSSPSEPDTWLVNRPRYLGRTISDQAIEENDRVVAGDVNFFGRDIDRIFKANERLCKIKTEQREGRTVYIGDCVDCCKELGCFGAWLLRLVKNDLEGFTLSDITRPMGDRRKGGKFGRKHFGGRSLAPNQVITLPDNDSVEAYFQRQSASDLKELCKYLELPYSNRNKQEKVRLIVDFHEKASGLGESDSRRIRNTTTKAAKRRKGSSGVDDESRSQPQTVVNKRVNPGGEGGASGATRKVGGNARKQQPSVKSRSGRSVNVPNKMDL
jgi:hypothetical protein